MSVGEASSEVRGSTSIARCCRVGLSKGSNLLPIKILSNHKPLYFREVQNRQFIPAAKH